MNLKNYASTAPANSSISKIERKLVEIGAKSVNKEYANGVLVGVRFLIDINHNTVAFELPAKVDRVFEVLWKEISKPQKGTEQRIREQAERTAWKIICDWVEVQASMILLEQAEVLQVFLPYALVGHEEKTLFTSLKENGFKLLNAPI